MDDAHRDRRRLRIGDACLARKARRRRLEGQALRVPARPDIERALGLLAGDTTGLARRRGSRCRAGMGPDKGPRRQRVAGIAHPRQQSRAGAGHGVGKLHAAPLHEHPTELALLRQELVVALEFPQGRTVAVDHEMGLAEVDPQRLGEQRPVAEPALFRQVHDVEGAFAGTQPVEQRPRRGKSLRQLRLHGDAGRNRLERHAKAGVEAACLLHELRIAGVVGDIADHHIMSPLRQQARQMMVGDSRSFAFDRAADTRGGDADSLPSLLGPVVKPLTEIRVERRECVRCTAVPVRRRFGRAGRAALARCPHRERRRACHPPLSSPREPAAAIRGRRRFDSGVRRGDVPRRRRSREGHGRIRKPRNPTGTAHGPAPAPHPNSIDANAAQLVSRAAAGPRGSFANRYHGLPQDGPAHPQRIRIAPRNRSECHPHRRFSVCAR